MKKGDFILLFSRYLLLIVIALGNLALFYALFTPLTLYASYGLIKLFFGTTILKSYLSMMVIGDNGIELVEACIAGAAYYLLTVLNLTTPMSLSKRIRSLIFSYVIFFVLNVTRIFIFAALFLGNFSYFDLAHRFVWYIGSTILLIGIWFLTVKVYDIADIPVYSDFKSLLGEAFSSNNSQTNMVKKQTATKKKKKKGQKTSRP